MVKIFIEKELVNKGVLPAINVGLSVSRVGSAAQANAMREVVGSLKLQLAQYREIENFASYSSDLDAITLRILERGSRLVEILKQQKYAPLTLEAQVVILFAAMFGYLDKVKVQAIRKFEQFIIYLINQTFYTKLLHSMDPYVGVQSNTVANFLSQSVYLFGIGNVGF